MNMKINQHRCTNMGFIRSSYTQTLLLMVVALFPSLATSAATALPGCRDRCGDVAIPYPFGVGAGCYLDVKFNISCVDDDNSASSPPKAYLGTRKLNVTEISILSSELRVLQYVARDCYNSSGYDPRISRDVGIATLPWGFTVSAAKNKFTALGCDTSAVLRGYTEDGKRYSTGCMAVCDRIEDVDFRSCSGMGCCQTASVPGGLVNVSVWLDSSSNHSQVLGFNPCSFAVLAEESQFSFSEESFQDFAERDDFPLVVDWRIGNLSCEEARVSEGFACKGNSDCLESKTGIGYVCKCSPGFDGNPYHPEGCHDVDECKDQNPCINGICTNTIGGFDCTCLHGYTRINGTVCSTNVDSSSRHRPAKALLLYVPLGASIGVIALVLVSLMLCLGHRKRKLIAQREKFFEQNGGSILQRRLFSDQQGSSFETAKIFTEEELKKATDNYRQIVGEGGYGTVYKGILPDKKVVAIKKPKISARAQTQQQTEQFINEVFLLMQINHRNVVRLLGCCLDTEVPILVYEFISNGTLFERIHKKATNVLSVSWELRLKIAAETAGALAYLHCEINTPIVHRDVKTMNILLDEKYTAKISDFGTSRLVPLDEEQLSTLVQGTIGYLDPEYLQSSKLTEKSDVYSFGVVLAELLTGMKAFSFNKSEGTTNNLAISFLSIEDDQLRSVVDEEIDFEANVEAIMEVANLAKRCLRVKGDERPTMKEVAMELEGLRAMSSKHAWEKVDLLHIEESEYLPCSHSFNMDPYDHGVDGVYGSTDVVQYDSFDARR